MRYRNITQKQTFIPLFIYFGKNAIGSTKKNAMARTKQTARKQPKSARKHDADKSPSKPVTDIIAWEVACEKEACDDAASLSLDAALAFFKGMTKRKDDDAEEEDDADTDGAELPYVVLSTMRRHPYSVPVLSSGLKILAGRRFEEFNKAMFVGVFIQIFTRLETLGADVAHDWLNAVGGSRKNTQVASVRHLDTFMDLVQSFMQLVATRRSHVTLNRAAAAMEKIIIESDVKPGATQASDKAERAAMTLQLRELKAVAVNDVNTYIGDAEAEDDIFNETDARVSLEIMLEGWMASKSINLPLVRLQMTRVSAPRLLCNAPPCI